jgi:hypothetical protein
MKDPTLLMDIAPEERTPLVEYLLSMIKHQSATIEVQSARIEALEEKIKTLASKVEQVEQVEGELKKAKKLKGRPLLKASQLEQAPSGKKAEGKRPGSAKRSQKDIVKIDEERVIEPAQVPLGQRSMAIGTMTYRSC